MKCTERKKKLLLYITEKLMTGAGIELRDTWKGIEKETFEVTFISGEGPCTFDAEKDVAVGYKSLTYTNPIFNLPELYGDTAHQLIHEAVHFLQHND
jgi:hypothetical protein